MGKIKRGGFVFITYKGDHDPLHVHIFRDGQEIAKWNLEDWALMRGKVNRRIMRLLGELFIANRGEASKFDKMNGRKK